MCCRMGLEVAAEEGGNRDTACVSSQPRLSLSALWGGGTGEGSGQSHCWGPWESSLSAACPARASPHMPAMTAQLWENLLGLQGLGRAVREGWRAEPWPLLSASAVSPVGGNSEGCWHLHGAWGAVMGTTLHLPPHWSFQTHPSEGKGWERGARFPVPCPPYLLVCDFDLLPLSLQLFPPASSLWWLGCFSHDSLRLDLAVPCLCQSNLSFLL